MAEEVQVIDEAVVVISDDDEGTWTWRVGILWANKCFIFRFRVHRANELAAQADDVVCIGERQLDPRPHIRQRPSQGKTFHECTMAQDTTKLL